MSARRRRRRGNVEEEVEEVNQRRRSRGSRSNRGDPRRRRESVVVEEDVVEQDGYEEEMSGEENYEDQLSQERGYNEDEMNEIVGNVMNFILLKNSKRIPVKMSEISTKFIQSKNRQSKLDNKMVMNLVGKRFKEHFGYKLKELPREIYNVREEKKKSKTKKRSKNAIGTNTYILMNANKSQSGIKDLNMICEHELKTQGLLMVIYSMILLSKGKIDETTLKRQLRAMGAYQGFIDLDNILKTTFVKQKYLNRTKRTILASQVASQSDDLYEYSIGKRGICETDKSKIFKFMYQAINKRIDPMRLKLFEMEQAQRNKDMEDIVAATQEG